MQEASPADTGAAPPAADGSELNVPFTAASVAKGIESLHLDLDLVTYCAVNWLTIAQARRQTEMHSGRQRAEV